MLFKHLNKRFWEGVIIYFLELLREYMGAGDIILVRLLGGLRGKIYLCVAVFTYRRFYCFLAEFSKGLSGCLLGFGVVLEYCVES